MFPVGEALMLSPRGNAVQSHFPFICCMSFNVYNHLQSHRALRVVHCLHSGTSVMFIRAASKFDLNLIKKLFSSVGVLGGKAQGEKQNGGSEYMSASGTLLLLLF